MHDPPLPIQIRSLLTGHRDGRPCPIVPLKERLGGAAGDDAGALVVEERRGAALEDADVGGAGEAVEGDGGHEAGEGAAYLDACGLEI